VTPEPDPGGPTPGAQAGTEPVGVPAGPHPSGSPAAAEPSGAPAGTEPSGAPAHGVSPAPAPAREGLRSLRLTGYRNLQDAVLEIPPEGLALVGANAQGKSNFLEAIHYLEIFRSFRGTRDRRLVRFDADFFRIEAELGGMGREAPRRTVAAAVIRAGGVKKVSVDGETPPRIGDALGQVGSVLFTPDDVRLVSDGPQERRRFLDIVLSVHEPGYLEALQRYRQVLNQRNAALRERARGGAVEAWDGLLARAGGVVLAARAAWVARGASSFASVVAEISGGERASVAYAPALPELPAGGLSGDTGTDPAPWGEALAQALRSGAEQERRRGTTLFGPQRDELELRLEPGDDRGQGEAPGGEPTAGPGDEAGAGSEGAGRPRDLREYGSGGQKRTAALALRILEAETVLRRRGRPAILLLDDVFAELDAARSERVLGLLDRTAAGQVILTAPKDSDVRLRHDRLPRWRIREGRIAALEGAGGHDG
jgi:DNA replication and repair protein RecF